MQLQKEKIVVKEKQRRAASFRVNEFGAGFGCNNWINTKCLKKMKKENIKYTRTIYILYSKRFFNGYFNKICSNNNYKNKNNNNSNIGRRNKKKCFALLKIASWKQWKINRPISDVFSVQNEKLWSYHIKN